MRRIQAFFLIITVLVVSGCSDSSAPPDENLHDGVDSNLLDVAWELRQYTTSSGSLSAVDEATKYQFHFDSESTNVEVFIGCVNYSGSTYDKRDGFLLIELGTRDAIVCNTETEEFAEQTHTIMNLLQDEGGEQGNPLMYTVSNDNLQLESTNGSMLIFEQVETVIQQDLSSLSPVIANTKWTILSFQDREGVKNEIPSDAQWSLRFINDSTNSSSKLRMQFGPCHYYGFTYSYQANEIQKQGEIVSPDLTCSASAPIRLPELQRLVYQMFADSNTHLLSADDAGHLVLSADTGEIFELEKVLP